ncbi:hypothetical protein ACFVAJ_16870 [Agromyces sp. NPDC057679]|uniref:hypothetical protein n=1 Tax=Agromyces sp. NPDC057679 TaxID=3346207 RepID=UPI003672F738
MVVEKNHPSESNAGAGEVPPPVRIEPEQEGRRSDFPMHLILDLTRTPTSSLPSIPKYGTPTVFMVFNDGLQTHLQYGSGVIRFWRKLAKAGSDLRKPLQYDDQSNILGDLSEEERKTVIDFGKALHDRASEVLNDALKRAFEDPVLGGRFVAMVRGMLYDPVTNEGDNVPASADARAVRGMSLWTGWSLPQEPIDATAPEVEAAVGVIADIRHWALVRGVNFEDLLADSEALWQEERQNPLP